MKFNKKMVIMLCSVIAVILFVIVVMMLFAGGGSKVLEYSVIEDKIVSAGKEYYEDNQDKLPKNGTISLNVSELVSAGYLSDLSTYTEEGVTCVGTLYVTKNPADYIYRAKLDCDSNYKTKKFKEVIIDNVVTAGSGLYEEVQINPEMENSVHTVYVFKGDNVNNYVKVGDYFWRIVKVLDDGRMMVIGDAELLRTNWDDRFNIEENAYRGINNYLLSRMRDTIQSEVVEAQDGYLLIKSLITTHSACVGNRYLNDTSRDGSAECTVTLPEQYFSLLPVYDYMNASLDENCIKAVDDSCYNYNYLTYSNDEWWTITGVADNSFEVYFVDGTIDKEYASVNNNVRMVAYLDANVTYVSGTGTYEDPYILK